MNPSLAIASIQRDPSWVRKFIQAGLFSLLPVIGPLFLLGWQLEMIRAALNQQNDSLPEPALLDCLAQGFQTWLILLIYTIPLFLFAIPIWIAPVITVELPQMERVFISTGLLLILVYSVFFLWLLPAVLGQFAAFNTLSSAVQFRHVIALAFTAPGIFTKTFLLTVASFALAQTGILLCVIGTGFTNSLAVLLVAQLYAQAYRSSAASQSSTS